ncbi:MAG TPA: hypothetical protein VNO79_08785 [Actinomycetota bacterium]|nr:hypothetical protein [Actinomycetota bacterium]
MAVWRLDLYDRVGATLKKQGLPFLACSARWVLNGPGALEADFDLYADFGAELPEPGRHELKLLRDGVVVWAGPIWEADVDPDQETVKLTAEGLWSWLRSRVVTENLHYTSVAQQEIAWGLIAHTQAQTDGALGLVQGAHSGSSVARTRHYCGRDRPNIADAVEAFTALDDGFDFEIDPATRAFNTWSPQRKPATGIALDGTKVDLMPYRLSARDLVTYVTGRGEGDCAPILADVSDATLAASYGRRQVAVDVRGDTTAEVQAEAREELRAGKRVRHDQEIRFRDGGTGAPAWSSLELGGTLMVSDDRGYATYSKTLRIVERSVLLTNETPTVAYVGLVLSSAVD